ncbi:MAG: hypothetical protein AAF558_12140 [Verrucomicrobiota bacterium]
MSLALGIRLALFGLLCMQTTGLSQRKDVVPVFSVTSEKYPIRIVSRDSLLNLELLPLVEQTAIQFSKMLGIRKLPVNELVVRWKPGIPDFEGPFFSYPRQIGTDGGRISLTVELKGELEGNTFKVRRSIVIALLQALTWDGEAKISIEELADPPLWLSEGLLWSMVSTRDEQWQSIVMKAGRIQRVPSLVQIQEWDLLSEFSVERYWQQAFSYWLFKKAVITSSEKRAIRLWLKKLRTVEPEPFWTDSAQTEVWWQKQVDSPTGKAIPVLGWEQTVASLSQALHFSIRVEGGSRKMIQIRELPNEVLVGFSPTEVKEAMQKLELLELKAHFLWRPVVEAYRQALGQWMVGEYAEYRKAINQARLLEERIRDQHRASKDMLDWAVVNLEFQATEDQLTDYAKLVRELEKERERVRLKNQRALYSDSF